MGNRARRGAGCSTARVALTLATALIVCGPSLGEDRKWTLQFEPIHVSIYGHDQHVLTIHEADLDAAPPADSRTGVNLVTDSDLSLRGEFRYTGEQWGWGVDLFWVITPQDAGSRTAAADGSSGTVDRVEFEIADRTFASTDPGEVLFYETLEDTDLEIWTLDFYGMRTLAEKSHSRFALLFGLRLGDFDNDYFAVTGIQDVAGTSLGASSNYDLMMGPLVGLAGDLQRGKNRVEGYIGQSVMIGSAGLTHRSTDFTGSVAAPTFVDEEFFRTTQDVAIPITELRLKWTYGIGRKVALGVGTHTSIWLDVPVPPGVRPIDDGDNTLHENTLVFFGLAGIVELTF